MACRHHSMELMITVGYITIFSPSTGPEVTLFKGLQEVWNSLDPTDIDLPTLPPSLKQQKADLLRFVNSKLSDPGSTPQDDYKEFLELAKHGWNCVPQESLQVTETWSRPPSPVDVEYHLHP